MRRVAAAVVALMSVVPLATALTSAVALPRAEAAPAAKAPAAPPHAFLFGAWVGGIFPPPVTLSAQACLADPMVIFTQDAVMRAVMTTPTYLQRPIQTARATATGFEIQFAPRQSPADATFGCPNPDVLPVQHLGQNEISFPGCTDFPFPLIRCAPR